MKTMLLAILAVGLLLFGCTNSSSPPAQQPAAQNNQQSANGQQPPAGSNQQPAASTPSGSGSPTVKGTGSGTLFSNSQYAGNAVEIFPGSSNGPSSGEIPNFAMSTALQADGSTVVTMTEKAGGQTLQATVPKGGSLYFNDANMGDDASGQDKFLQDDTLVVVDANGYIVPQQQAAMSPQNNAPPMQPNGSAGMPKPPNLVGTKFSDWRYYSMANPIAPGNISADAQAALNIFTVQQTQQPDGSLLVTVKDNPDGTVSNFTVTTGETLYFADGNPADDIGTESDSSLIDDHFVLVDSNGMIVQMLSTP